ncbi:alanine--glyoxylate aminotransferase family protein [Aestuariibacter sp. AA17]|uniref:Alanine--glyoxylate aminotransferase family protein n=1 Tax=Fluctibacter corallii TaxID=2984329 RepID=A0ABT3A671_9ALTE|nr:alanine--glyoxylate aminotransferase family protein [Aestuariibacter sp. AA17]MCV2884135.1 alanine--glyoxylate aminotransferase family protein [Aestuariibacter sp. AA17]
MSQEFSVFNPPKRTLMGPGPSDVSPAVLNALSKPTLGHLDPQFVSLMDDVKSLLQYAFKTKNTLTMPISAPGSAGMEACLANLVEPGDKVIVCQNGVFGGRMYQNVIRCGGEAVLVEDPWGEQTKLDKLASALKAHPDAKIVAFVHAETSTGVMNDAQALCQLAREHGCLTLVDAVTSLAGSELRVDEWGIDAIYSGSQKCLSCVPGLSPISFSEAAIEKIKGRKTPVQSWFLDMDLVMGYWGKGAQRAYHHTAPVNSIYALYESLRLVHQEGLENAWNRHQQNHIKLKEGLASIGLTLAVDEAYCLPQLNAVTIPEGVDDKVVRSALLNDFNLEIGAGLGQFAGKVWRIGLMGHTSNEDNVNYCINALKTVLERG